MDWQPYITGDNAVLRDKPIIKGTRISVELILELMEQGWTEAMILESYSHIRIRNADNLGCRECVFTLLLVTSPY